MKLKYESSAYHTVLHKNPLLRFFFRWKFRKIIKFAGLKKEDLILDFGCGDKWLKKILPGYRVIGYDLNPKQTEVKDYRKIKPDKIFALDVFEHIPREEIRGIIRNFKKMNPNFELITSIPTENWISRKTRKVLGKRERAIDHITPIKEILPILLSELKLIKKMNLFTVSYIAKFRNKTT
jgi:2-polyprenyl-3-methyl-5-hydroxy-6-metoxy-1,4-benzoquinol methylase